MFLKSWKGFIFSPYSSGFLYRKNRKIKQFTVFNKKSTFTFKLTLIFGRIHRPSLFLTIGIQCEPTFTTFTTNSWFLRDFSRFHKWILAVENICIFWSVGTLSGNLSIVVWPVVTLCLCWLFISDWIIIGLLLSLLNSCS